MKVRVMSVNKDILLKSTPESAVRWNKEIAEQLDRFPIHVVYNKQLDYTTKHNQPGLEIHITQAGRAAFISGGQLLLQKHRHVLLHGGESPHQFVGLADQSFRRTVICIDRRLVNNPIVCLDWLSKINICHLVLDAKAYSLLMDYCRNLRELLRDRNKYWEQLAIAQLLRAAVCLERYHDHRDDSEMAGSHREEISALVQQCVHYVYAHLEENLSLEQMAVQFSISREHLTRSFTKQLGISFHRFVLGAKVDYTKQLMLEHQELSMTEISGIAGFATPAHFSSVFRDLTGCSPTQYRKQVNDMKEPSP
jgi:AraC-like DNA-binding protein